MRMYHRTFHSERILAEGFRDATGNYMADRPFTGVWFSTFPLDINEGADGDVVLMLKIPAREIKRYEWVEEGKPYREFLIPAELANKYGPPVIVDPDTIPDPRFPGP